MSGYTEEQVEEMVREAVEKTEKSFGGTFKRLKSENENLASELESLRSGYSDERREMEERLGELESLLADSRVRVSELAVRGELMRQLRDTGPLPEQFVDIDAIAYSEDPQELKRNVTEALERGRREFDSALEEMGVQVPETQRAAANPTNPANRGTAVAHDLRRAEAQTALRDMTRRGLLR